MVADACQTAWAILLRRPDISLDACGLGWLTVVAVHEVHGQWRDRARNLPMGALSLGTGDPGELSEPAAIGDDEVEEVAAAHLEHAERVADLAALKPAERTALYLQALGYRYREIGAVTDASYTAVNRRRLRAELGCAGSPASATANRRHERRAALRGAPWTPALARSRNRLCRRPLPPRSTPAPRQSAGPASRREQPPQLASPETHSLLAADSRRLNE